MQVGQVMPLKKTFFDNAGDVKQQNTLTKVSTQELSIDDLNHNQLKELHTKLIEKGLTLDLVLDKYKEFAETKPKYVRASDVLNVLSRVEELLGLRDKSEDQITIRALTQSKSSDEITTTLIEITGKTQEYLNKLQQRKDE